jgi:hypothetical protein
MDEGFRWAKYYCTRGVALGLAAGAVLLGAQAFTGGFGPSTYPSAMTVAFAISLPAALLAYPAWALLGDQLPDGARHAWFLAMGLILPAANGLLLGYLVACWRVIRESRRRPLGGRADH